MSRYNYCDTTDRIYFKKDAKKAKELIISEDACDRLNDLERQLAEAIALAEEAIHRVAPVSQKHYEAKQKFKRRLNLLIKEKSLWVSI